MKKNARMEVVYHEYDHQDRYKDDDSPNCIEVTVTRWSKDYPNAQNIVVIHKKVVINDEYEMNTKAILTTDPGNAQLQRFGIKVFDQLKADYPQALAEVSE